MAGDSISSEAQSERVVRRGVRRQVRERTTHVAPAAAALEIADRSVLIDNQSLRSSDGLPRLCRDPCKSRFG